MFQDLAYALRLHRRSPAFALLAIIVFGVGIGITSTVFSLVHSILLRPLPFQDADRLYHLERFSPARDNYNAEVNEADFTRWRQDQTVFEDLAAFRNGTINVSDGENPIRYDGSFISASFLQLLRVQPVLGRGFTPAEDRPGAAPVVLIGYRSWQEDFGGDPGIVGRAVRINSEPGLIVGVMPEGFLFPINNQAWIPLRADPLRPRDEQWTHEVIGVLRADRSLDQAMAEFNALAARLAGEHADAEGITQVTIKPFRDEFVGDGPQGVLTMMFILGVLVLLVACFNVANLLLARAAGRIREFAIRTALGARRSRVIRQMLIETLVLALGGAVLGWFITIGGVALLWRQLVESNPPFFFELRVDGAVTAFVFAVAMLSALVAGLLPAWRSTGGDLAGHLKDGGRSATGHHSGLLARALVVLQLALSSGLLVVAGLLAVTMTDVYRVDLPFSPTAVIQARIGLFEGDYPDDASRVLFQNGVVDRLANAPGVAAASASTRLQMGGVNVQRVMVEGEAYAEITETPLAREEVISPGHFDVMSIGLREGRAFLPTDVAGAAPVAIINTSLQARLFPEGRALERRFRLAGDESEAERPWMTVVGVVDDAYMEGIPNGFRQNVDGAGYYVPFAQRPTRFFTLLARSTAAEAGPLATTLRDVVRAQDPNLPAYFVETAAASISRQRVIWTFIVTVFLAFGVVALLLATVGLFGMTAFSVAQRRTEFGIRLALGAPPRSLSVLVLRRGGWQLLWGLLPGLLLGAGLAYALQNVLQEMPLTNPLVYLVPALVLAVACLLACAVPARRAARTDPMVVLRSE